jgi:hypothetical protein
MVNNTEISQFNWTLSKEWISNDASMLNSTNRQSILGLPEEKSILRTSKFVKSANSQFI